MMQRAPSREWSVADAIMSSLQTVRAGDCGKDTSGWSISRILSIKRVCFRTAPEGKVISLGWMLPSSSCSLPGTNEEAGSFLPLEGGHRPCLALLLVGVAWPPHYCSAGGLLHRHFTLTLAGGVFLWPDPVGSSRRSPRSGCYPAPCPVECGLSSKRNAFRDPLTSLTISS